MRLVDVRRAMAARYGVADVELRWGVTGPHIRTANGLIYGGVHSALPGAVAIKWVRDGSEAVQYEALKRAAVAFRADDEFGVPRPVEFLAERAIILMEWIDGAPLATHVTRRTWATQRALSQLDRAGRWLARFHAIEPAPPRTLPTGELTVRLWNELGEEPADAEPVVEAAMHTLRSAADAAEAEPVAAAIAHGDFKPDNILLSDARTVGIDFIMRHRDVVALDQAHFLNHLALLAYEPRGVAAWLFPHHAAMAHAFLAGYAAESGVAVARLPLAWMRLHDLVRQYAAQRARVGGGPRKGYLLGAIGLEIDRAARDLEALAIPGR